jgi:hypothetical protein
MTRPRLGVMTSPSFMPSEYLALARQRVQDERAGFQQPEEFGYKFRRWVSPYTKCAHGRGGIAIVLQDWASADWLAQRFRPEVQEWGRDCSLLTNRRLDALVRSVLKMKLSDTYVTNAFPFVKPGGMGARLSRSAVADSVAKYTVEELRITSPPLVLALGALAAYGLSQSGVAHVALPHPAARIGGLLEHERVWNERLRGVNLSIGAAQA